MAKKQRNPEPELWERQLGESEEAYGAFVLYRDMEKRRFNVVAEQLHKSYALIRRWKDRWYWGERVLAYDNELQKQKLAKKIKERDEMYDRHAKMSGALQALASQAMNSWLKKLQENPEELDKMSVRDIGYLTKIATDLDRLSRNEQIELEKMGTVESGEAGNAEGGVVVYVPEILPEESYEMDEEDEE